VNKATDDCISWNYLSNELETKEYIRGRPDVCITHQVRGDGATVVRREDARRAAAIWRAAALRARPFAGVVTMLCWTGR
jgi:hypothetical protein